MSIFQNNSIWFKFLAVLLVVALLFTFVLPSPQAKAIALVDDAVLVAGAAVAVMIAAGITFTSQNIDADSFGSFISGKLDNFISSEGTGSVSDYASGITLNPNGVGLNVTDPTMRFLDRFLNWFKSDESLTSDSKSLFSSNTFSGVSLLSFPSYFVYDGFNYLVRQESTGIYLYRSTGTNLMQYDRLYYTSSNDYPSSIYFDFSNGTFRLFSDSSWVSFVNRSWQYMYSDYPTFPSLSSSYTANPAYTVSDTQTGTVPFIIVIDETAAGGSGGNNNKHDTARDAAISALQLGLAGKLLSSVTQSSSDPGQEGGDTNVSADVSGIRAAVNSIKNWLDTTFESFTEVCTQFFTDVRLFFADFWTNFTTKLQEVFKTSLETIHDLLGNIKTGISSAADTIGGKIDSIGTKISYWWEEWRSSKNDKPTSFFGSGFNSIWHYVVEWLSYIGGFLSLVLNVWSVLPYGMVVPVYASVVLILYFGIYRKFIK